MGVHAVRPGASDTETVATGKHGPLDRAIPRAGHRRQFAESESTVTEVRDQARRAVVRTPDPKILDPIVAPPARPARFPIVQTIRRGAFVDQPLLGNRLPLQRAQAAAAPQQEMEASPTARRNTFRITPVPWDEELIEMRGIRR